MMIHLRNILILIMAFFLQGYMLGNPLDSTRDQKKKMLLTEAISLISQQYNVYFTFDHALVSDITVEYVTREALSVEEAISGVLDGTDLKFKLYDRRFVILYQNDEEGLESLKEMVKHFEHIIADGPEKKTARRNFEPMTVTPLRDAWNPPVRKLENPVLNVSGVVTDEDGEPLIGVNVQVKGINQGTATDFEGEYSLVDINENAILVFSYIGYLSQEIPVNGRTTVDVLMISDAQLLDEVVVVGYGTQKKVNLTGSVTTVGADFLESRPLTNASQALQGINGIYVNQAGGEPGADNATLRIRGVGTLNNNNPLILVDGIQYELRDINPNDIESISVLKDAASASIYGNRAANGVILITTKKGISGKLKVELNSYFGVQQATYLPDMVTNSMDYILARNQAAINEGQPPPYSEEQVEEFRNGNNPDLYPNTDWYETMFSAAPMQDHYLRISGGNEMTIFSMSLGYMNQDGILIGTDAKKYSVNTNLIFKPFNKLEIGGIINVSSWDKHSPYKGIGGGDDSAMGAIARALPIHPNILSDGRYGTTWLVTPGHNVFRHPVARALEGGNNAKTQRGMVNLYGQYVFPFDINYKITYAVDKFDGNEHIFTPEIHLYTPKEPDSPKPNGKDVRSVEQINRSNLSTSFLQTLNWNRILAETHDVGLLLGFSRETFYNSNSKAYIEGFLGNELTELNAGTLNKDVGGTSSQSRLMSYFGRANYTFAEKYLLEVNARYDGSSRFAKGKRWGLFPSFSAGWRISEEDFMQNIASISNLKLRVSWGELGNQIISLYSFLNNININQGTTFNNSVVAGSAVTALSDPDITWETTTIKNIGLDIGFWDSKLEIVVDVFDKKTTDILARINIPSQVGNLAGPITNLYGMSNKGFEISTTYRNSLGEFDFRIGGNIAVVQNKVDFLNGDIQYTTNSFGNIRVIKEGYPVNSWYLYEAIGIFNSKEEVQAHAFQDPNTGPGDIIYRDFNNDGKIDINDTRVLGRSIPRFTYGFNLGIDFKRFDFAAFFQGVEGIDIYPTNNVSWPLYNGAGITKDQLANSWTPDNQNAKYPRLSLQKRGTGINARNSTFWLKDASYLRLKNLQLGYTLASDWSDNIKITRLRIYANAQNYLTFSKFKLSDPEKDILDQNIYGYPTTKIVTIGFNITF